MRIDIFMCKRSSYKMFFFENICAGRVFEKTDAASCGWPRQKKKDFQYANTSIYTAIPDIVDQL